MDISVVLLTWNSQNFIELCLNSLIRDINHSFEYEIFVVDNGSTDDTRIILEDFKARLGRRFHTIFLERNYGTTYTRNLALKRAVGTNIIVMDSDVEVIKGAIRHLVDLVNDNSQAGIVAPGLIYSDGTYQKSTDIFPTLPSKLIRYFFLRLIEKKEATLEENRAFQEVDYAISAMWVMRKEILSKVGFLDEKIFYAPEDVDYCLRIWKAGYKVLYAPYVTCIHHAQELSRGLRLSKSTWEHIKGLIYYFRKHGYFLSKPRL